MSELDIVISPSDQRRAAELIEANLANDADNVGRIIADIGEAGLVHALATAALLARHLATTLTALLGADAAARMIERTRLDAMLADNDE